MTRLEQLLVITESELDGSFLFPYVPISFVFVAEIVDACNDVLSFLPSFSHYPFRANNLLSYVPVLIRFWYGGTASIRIVV